MMKMAAAPNEIPATVVDDYSAANPSVLAGYKVKFSKEIAVLCKNSDVVAATPRKARVQILHKKVNKELKEVRVEIIDDEDISFIYVSLISPEAFQKIKDTFQLRVEYKQMAASLSSIIENTVKDPEHYTMELSLADQAHSIVRFSQNLRSRSVVLLELQVGIADEEYMKAQAQYRFNCNRLELEKWSAEYNNITEKAHNKNPSLFKRLQTQMKKAPEAPTHPAK